MSEDGDEESTFNWLFFRKVNFECSGKRSVGIQLFTFLKKNSQLKVESSLTAVFTKKKTKKRQDSYLRLPI
jgi:hypothetical protein